MKGFLALKGRALKTIVIIMATQFFATNTKADISPSQADYFLIKNPAHKYKMPKTNNVMRVEALAAPMFSSDDNIRYGQGLQNFKVLRNLALNDNNPYALYNVGMYIMLTKHKLNFELSDALLYLKRASDLGVLEAKYALALIYQSQFFEVSTLVNTENKNPLSMSTKAKEELAKQIDVDAQKFKKISNQYILEAAQKGFEKAFLLACSSYITGDLLPKNTIKAAICYDNAVRFYDSPIAYGRLAKIYFDSPEFDGYEFESKGIELAKKGMQKNDAYSMAILGKQLIYPKHLPYSNSELGIKMIQGSAAIGEPIAIKYSRDFFDGSGRLLRQPTKPEEPKVSSGNGFTMRPY